MTKSLSFKKRSYPFKEKNSGDQPLNLSLKSLTTLIELEDTSSDSQSIKCYADKEKKAYPSTDSSSSGTDENEIKKIKDELRDALNGSDESDSFKNKQELLSRYYCHQVFDPSIHTVIDDSLEIGDELRMMAQNKNFLPTLMALREPPPEFQRKKTIPKNSPPDLPSTSGGINEKNKKLFFPSHGITSRIYPIIDVDKNKKYIPHIDQTNDAFFPWNKSKHAKQLQPIPIIEYTMEKYNEDIDKQLRIFGLDAELESVADDEDESFTDDEDEDALMMSMMQTEYDLD